MAVVVRIRDGSLTPEQIVRSLPERMTAVVIREWVEVKKVGESRRDGGSREEDGDASTVQEGNKKVRTRTINHGYVLVDRSGIEPLRGYSHVSVFSNFYPRRFDDPRALYVKFTPAEKVAAMDFINSFCVAVKTTPPNFVTMNGYGFINFDDDSFVPMIAGTLRRLPALKFSTIYYGRLKEPQGEQEGDDSETKGEGKEEGKEEGKRVPRPPREPREKREFRGEARERGVPKRILRRGETEKEVVVEDVQALKQKIPRARRQKVVDAEGFTKATKTAKVETEDN